MAHRAVGALLAFAAAILFATTLLASVAPTIVPGWWDGHPKVNGKTYELKDVHVGMLGARGCDERGCQSLELAPPFETIGLGELAVAAIAMALAFALALNVWRLGDRRKLLARLAMASALLAAAGAVLLIMIGPEIQSDAKIEVPLGLGLILFWTGVVATICAGVLAHRLESEPLRLKASAAPPPPVDVRELLREKHDDLAPAAPRMGSTPHMPSHEAPLFDAAPQLRPLYDPLGEGVVPQPPPPALPARGPTPYPRQQLDALAGFTPSPPAGPRTATGSAIPPMRPKPPSAPPPRPSRPPDDPGKSLTREKLSMKPTIAHAIPPPPTVDNIAPPSKLPAGVRLDSEARDTDFVTTVEVDAEAKAAATARREAVNVEAEHTDTGVEVPRPDPFTTSEERLVSVDEMTSPRSDIGDIPGDHTDQIAAQAGEQMTAHELGLTTSGERPSQVPISTAPKTLPPPKVSTTVPSGPTPACPQCEAPMAWVEEHLRFYCKQCRMYF